ncbi:hypothetical protein WJ95_09390 [Burkholderia ubonensis]|uniref:hypothetical protein n=1 Tax=Burkholderia ubonensis TaxID=101571 RepID=UPI00075343E2|nr:hypothetical protein [Burkholderia ubonensis]KVP90710.1 hypothetical protein WJ95_09390 [Burkholderia ubonensis]
MSEELQHGAPLQPEPQDGKRVTYHEEDGKMHVRYEQDVETVLKLNHADRAAEGAFDKRGEFNRVMRVPEVIMLEIRFKYGWDYQNPDHWPMVKKILKGPEYAAFRTTNREI